jgi:hypothetical protein
MKLTLLLLLSAAAVANAATAIPTNDTISGVNLGTAGNYAILATTGISTVPDSSITGHIAVSPIVSSFIIGFDLDIDESNQFSTCTQVDNESRVYAPDYVGGSNGISTPALLTTAVGDMVSAYTDAMARLSTDASKRNLGGGEIGGMTLVSGVYTFPTTITISSDVTFSGDANSVFILQTSGSVTQEMDINVVLGPNVKAENIFWVVAGVLTVKSGAAMKGVLLIKTTVNFNTGSTLVGRILSQTFVTLQMASITEDPPRPVSLQKASITEDPSSSPTSAPTSEPTSEPTSGPTNLRIRRGL